MKKSVILLLTLMLALSSVSFSVYADETPEQNIILNVTDEKLEIEFVKDGISMIFENNTISIDGIIIFDDSEDDSAYDELSEEEHRKIEGWGAHRLFNEMSFSNNVQEIRSGLGFLVLRNIDKISLGKNVTVIGDDIFSHCKITEIDFPESLSSIGYEAFKSCELLDNVTIPENVKNIGDNAFADCTSLKDITILSKDVIISNSAFLNSSENSERNIRGYSGSSAEKYAAENGFNFITLNDNTEKVITIEDGPEHMSFEVLTGDLTYDGKINSADLLALADDIFGGEKVFTGDINFDGTCNIVDYIILKDSILNGTDDLYTKKISLDVAATGVPEPDPDKDEFGTLIKSVSELGEYLEENCKDKKLREDISAQYDDVFFEDNDLIALFYYQKLGKGIYSVLGDYSMWDLTTYALLQDETSKKATLCFGGTEYPEDEALYPVTNTSILARISVPKGKTDGYIPVYIDFSAWLSDDYRDLCSYSSPDNKNTIYISQSSFLLSSSIRVYRKDSENTYTLLATLGADDGFLPFNNDGKWKTDENGEMIFTDDMYYSLKWYDDHVDISYVIEPNRNWLHDSVYF